MGQHYVEHLEKTIHDLQQRLKKIEANKVGDVGKTKVLNSIKATIQNDKRRAFVEELNVTNVTYTETPVDQYGVGYSVECKVSVEFGAVTVISDRVLQSDDYPEMLEDEKRGIGRAIAHEVYGEVEKELIDIIVEMDREDPNRKRKSRSKVENLIKMVTYE